MSPADGIQSIVLLSDSDDDDVRTSSNTTTVNSVTPSNKPPGTRNVAVKRTSAPPPPPPQPAFVPAKNIRQYEAAEFLQDFNPEKSKREQTKRNALMKPLFKPTRRNNTSLYDEFGKLRKSGGDYCDCLSESCPGCHFDCANCGSGKCGPQCRVNRKWTYDIVEYDGKNVKKHNKHLE